ncbi:MAG: metallophosphoesterase [Planctomycetota bacterium]
MLIGILSDSHDHLDRLKQALAIFRERNCIHVIHAGDIVAPFAAKILAAAGFPLTVIYGNNDGERAGLAKILPGIAEGPMGIELDGRKITIVHALEALPPGRRIADVIIHGHTHEPGIARTGDTLLINPGECGGWLLGKPTVAILDTATLAAEIIPLT